MLLALLPLLSLFLAAGLLQSPSAGQAQSVTRLGVDLISDGDADSFVGSVQGCLEVDVGDSFPIDLYIEDAQGLRAWELRFSFDHELLQIVGHDFGQFLLSTDPSGIIFPSLYEMETADRYFLAASEFRGTPDSGSGVLARMSMQAMAPGRSTVTIVTEPSYIAPHLTDDNGTGVFAGITSHGEVAVGEPCSTSDPKPDQPPTSDSPSTGDDNGFASSPPAMVFLSDSPTRALSGTSEPTTSSESSDDTDAPSNSAASGEMAEGGAEEGSSEVGNTSDNVDALQPPGVPDDDSNPDQGQAAALAGDRGEGSSGFGWRQTIIVALVVAIGAGISLMALNLRSRP